MANDRKKLSGYMVWCLKEEEDVRSFGYLGLRNQFKQNNRIENPDELERIILMFVSRIDEESTCMSDLLEALEWFFKTHKNVLSKTEYLYPIMASYLTRMKDVGDVKKRLQFTLLHIIQIFPMRLMIEIILMFLGDHSFERNIKAEECALLVFNRLAKEWTSKEKYSLAIELSTLKMAIHEVLALIKTYDLRVANDSLFFLHQLNPEAYLDALENMHPSDKVLVANILEKCMEQKGGRAGDHKQKIGSSTQSSGSSPSSRLAARASRSFKRLMSPFRRSTQETERMEHRSREGGVKKRLRTPSGEQSKIPVPSQRPTKLQSVINLSQKFGSMFTQPNSGESGTKAKPSTRPSSHPVNMRSSKNDDSELQPQVSTSDMLALEAAKVQLALVNEQVDQHKNELSDLKKALADAKRRLAIKETDLINHQRLLKNRMRSIQM